MFKLCLICFNKGSIIILLVTNPTEQHCVVFFKLVILQCSQNSKSCFIIVCTLFVVTANSVVSCTHVYLSGVTSPSVDFNLL